MKKNIIIVCFFLLLFPECFAFYWETLPKGRFNLQYRNIQTNEITNSYDPLGNIQSNEVNLLLDGNSLYGANDILDHYFEKLKTSNPGAFNELEIGRYQLTPIAEVDVQVFGIGHGVSDTLTVYAGIPFYKAKVNIDFKRTKGNNYQGVATMLSGEDQGLLTNITNGLPDITEGVIQTVLTDYYGLKPLGSWVASGLGDIELGVMKRFYKNRDFGLLAKFGTVLPTGRVDDPDILQDIKFGDGQWDAFLEFGGGLKFFYFDELNLSARYTYQFSGEFNLRVPDLEGVSLGSRKTKIIKTPGDKIDVMVNLKKKLSSLFYVDGTYLFNFIGESKFKGNESYKLNNLIQNKFSQGSSLEAKIGLSTVNSYLQKEFFLPVDFNINYLLQFAGKNTQKVNRIQTELNLFF
jgi:hypothetical protein